MKHAWLIAEARKWVGIHEASENRGPIVDTFIKSTGGILGSPWCVSFARYCVEKVDSDADEIFPLSPEMRIHNGLIKTHSVMSLWDGSPEWSRSITPVPGWVACWRHYDNSGHATGLGHCGIVTKLLDSGRWFGSVEGNTGPDIGSMSRDGDGVYERTRAAQGSKGFRFLGSIDPWAKNPE